MAAAAAEPAEWDAAEAARVAAAVAGVALLDADEQPVASRRVAGRVPPAQLAVWARSAEGGAAGGAAALAARPGGCAVAVTTEAAGGGGGSVVQEHCVWVPDADAAGEAVEAVMAECVISFEDVPPAALVEYRYSSADEDDDEGAGWRLGKASRGALELFRAAKFRQWEAVLAKPSCEAELRRLVQNGPVFALYDHQIFPMPAEEAAQFVVQDEHGKDVHIPRPVHSLRVWDPVKRQYEAMDHWLDGIPAEADRDAYWKGKLADLRTLLGDEAFDALGAPKDDE